jgi:hypothetical protein
LVVTVTPATSVSFFRPEFNNFLYAPIGADGNDMPLSVLSALARLDVDPWAEAAELSELPKDTATNRLASLIARLPGGRWAQADSRAIAHRLIDLLPSRSSSKVRSPEKAHDLHEMTNSTVAKLLLCAALAVTALLIVASREPSSRGGHVGPPASGTVSPPQTVPQ